MNDAELEAVLARWDQKPPTDEELEATLGGGGGSLAPTANPFWLGVAGSTNVAAVIYWPRRPPLGILGMRFLNGGEYHYLGVEDYVWKALLHARSKGGAHWDLIRRRNYTCKCVTRPRKNWRRTQHKP